MTRQASELESQIDELYRLPLSEFTAARNALAKSQPRDEATRVKSLGKPTMVPWAVNQLFWRDRAAWDALLASGRALRAAQIASLTGKSADLRGATAAHREALSAAAASATALAAAMHGHPAADPLARMLEALSLAPEVPGTPGRFVEALQPAGFEALAGVTPLARPAATPPREATAAPKGRASAARAHAAGRATEDPAEATRRAAALEARRKAADAAVMAATRELDRARAAEARAQAQVDAVRQQLQRAEAALAERRASVAEAQSQLAKAQTARDAI
ncbi:MAG: hypothetical protein JSU08_11065 [Acidobacteria bacterium]|nr:hypothetical protein [Acidobacteriota bacterium]